MSSSPAPGLSRRRRGWIVFALALLLVWSLGLRLWLAAPELNENRFWDERYGVDNVTRLLQDGDWRPANGFHPGLSYLPAAALLAASMSLESLTGSAAFAVFDDAGNLNRTGYFLCRLLQVLAGVLSLGLTFHLGRRIASPAAGLWAALLLAVVPWHLRQSVIFKPDILLVAACLLAVAVSLWAVERPGSARCLAAGAAIGLALGTKFNAGPVALPLTFALLAEGGWRDPRRWRGLALAGGAAVAVFLLSTPFLVLAPGLYVESFGKTLADYADKGERLAGGSHLAVLRQGLEALLSGSYHGPLIGAAGLCGLLLAACRRPMPRYWVILNLRAVSFGRFAQPVDRPRIQTDPVPSVGETETSRGRRLGPRMALVYVAGYAGLYALSTTNPSDHNWLPVAPWICLAAAVTLLAAWAWWAARAPFLRRRAVAALAVGCAVVLLVQPAQSYVYELAVPSTDDLARDVLLAHLPSLSERVVYRESGDGPPLRLRDGRDFAAVHEVDHLDRVATAALDRADAEVFPARLLLGSRRFYRLRLGAGSSVVHIEPAALRVRGEALVVVVHPWREGRQGKGKTASALPLAVGNGGGSGFTAAVPESLRPGEVLSLDLSLPRRGAPEVDRVLVAGQPVEVAWTGRQAGAQRFSTDRFALPAAGARITVLLSGPPPDPGLQLSLRRWQAGP